MKQDQIFQLKLSALQLATKASLTTNEQLSAAKGMYEWLIEEAIAEEAAILAAKEAPKLV